MIEKATKDRIEYTEKTLACGWRIFRIVRVSWHKGPGHEEDVSLATCRKATNTHFVVDRAAPSDLQGQL
jgi:hypothetical protein